MAKKKMSGEDRKVGITMAARKMFAKKGFYGTSIREIAKAATVSEALIYQHFDSKTALYENAYFYIDPIIDALCEYFKHHEPSTETLVQIIYALSYIILSEIPGHQDEQKLFERLLVYSLLENTTFAKSVFMKYDKELTPLWVSSMATAKENGDMYEHLIDPIAKMWLSHHLAMAINFLQLSGETLFPYHGSKNDLIRGIVVFILRGIGLKDSVVRRHAQPDNLQEIGKLIFSPSSGLDFSIDKAVHME
ncbi:MAG: TetR/AcrR family transcriptional regulator [Proteobacteria bacterium]|nr:TetR/AcrR family transcriptional regulator [Pseudomonadota bacterium]